MAYQITAFYGALLAILMLLLAYRVSLARRSSQVGLGDGAQAALTQAIRVHGNFIEYVPLALLLLLLTEQTAMSRLVIHILGAALLVGRLIHAWGLAHAEGYSFGRFWGTLLTWLVILLCSLILLYMTVTGWLI